MGRFATKLLTKSTNELLNSFHVIPYKLLVINIVSLLYTIAYFIVISFVDNTLFMIVGMFVGALLIMLMLTFCPLTARLLVAREVKNRSSVDLGTRNVYKYVISEEEQYYGRYRYNVAEEIISWVNRILGVFTIIEYVFFVGMLLIIVTVLGLMIYALCFIVNILYRTEFFYRLQHLCFVPTTFIWRLFCSLSPRSLGGIFGSINSGMVRSDGITDNPEEMGTGLAEIKLRQEVSLGYYPVPSSMHWERSLNLDVDMSVITVTGKLVYSSDDSWAEQTLNNTIRDLESRIRQDLQRQVNSYFNKYRNSPRNVRISISIDGVVRR